MNPIEQTTRLGLLAFALVAGATLAACAGDAWLEESNPSGNALFDPRLAREIRLFWYVSEPQNELAAQLLRTQMMVGISPERAAPLIGRNPDVPAGESLYLIRAIDVANPSHIHIYQLGSWLQVSAGTNSTCVVFRSTMRRQPIVVALPQPPTRLRLLYDCNE